MRLNTKPNIKGVIFDLDGVIVDSAQFHYEAWKTLAREWNYDLKMSDNEALKGVSRKDSVLKIAIWAGVKPTAQELESIATRKNILYLELCAKLTPHDILPGIENLINELKNNNIKVALGSASKNARFVIEKLGLHNTFDVVVDGNDVIHSKPDPEVFLIAAQHMNIHAQNCCVIEDAPAGIQAAIKAQMLAIGLGKTAELLQAHLILPNATNLTLSKIEQLYQQILT